MKITSRLFAIALVIMLASWSLATGCTKEGGDGGATPPDITDLWGDLGDDDPDVDGGDDGVTVPTDPDPDPEIEEPTSFIGEKLAMLTAGDGQEQSGAEFGYSVSMSGDYAFVGAPAYSRSGASNSGIAYVFKKTEGSWSIVPIANLEMDSPIKSDLFGFSVAIDGDHALVGVPYLDDALTAQQDMGAVMFYERSGDNWEGDLFKMATIDGEANFGYSVAIDGDYAIVGAPGSSNAPHSHAGAAFIFHRVGDSWGTPVVLHAEADADTGDEFGHSVAISGDYAFVGAPKDLKMMIHPVGTVYVFHNDGGSWTKVAILSAEANKEPNARFGESVSIDGDFAVIGAINEDEGGEDNAGVAYIFHNDGTVWTRQERIAGPEAEDYAAFGTSVVVEGDYIIVGCPNKDEPPALGKGAAYLYHHSDTGWSYEKKIDGVGKASRFGSSISMDGFEAIIGAYQLPGLFELGAGTAYIYK